MADEADSGFRSGRASVDDSGTATAPANTRSFASQASRYFFRFGSFVFAVLSLVEGIVKETREQPIFLSLVFVMSEKKLPRSEATVVFPTSLNGVNAAAGCCVIVACVVRAFALFYIVVQDLWRRSQFLLFGVALAFLLVAVIFHFVPAPTNKDKKTGETSVRWDLYGRDFFLWADVCAVIFVCAAMVIVKNRMRQVDKYRLKQKEKRASARESLARRRSRASRAEDLASSIAPPLPSKQYSQQPTNDRLPSQFLSDDEEASVTISGVSGAAASSTFMHPRTSGVSSQPTTGVVSSQPATGVVSSQPATGPSSQPRTSQAFSSQPATGSVTLSGGGPKASDFLDVPAAYRGGYGTTELP